MVKKIKFTCTIKGTPLIKFQTKQLINFLQQGSFYMSSLKRYRDMYANSGDEIIGDPHEGRLCIHCASIFLPESDDRIIKIRDEALPTVSENDFVFCMFGIIPPNLGVFRFTEEQKSKLAETYDTALIIKDQNEFIKRINSQAKANGINIKYGFVKYYDESFDEASRLCSISEKEIDSVAFHKRNKYAYQQEYRFVVKNRDANQLYYEMNIGDISDISEQLPSVDVLNALLTMESI